MERGGRRGEGYVATLVAAGYPNSKRKQTLLIMSARRLNEWGSFAARGLRPSSTANVVLLTCAVAGLGASPRTPARCGLIARLRLCAFGLLGPVDAVRAPRCLQARRAILNVDAIDGWGLGGLMMVGGLRSEVLKRRRRSV